MVAQTNIFPSSTNAGIGIITPSKALHIHSNADINNDPAVQLSMGSVTNPNGIPDIYGYFALLTGNNNYYGLGEAKDVLVQASTTAGNLLFSTRSPGKHIAFFTERDFGIGGSYQAERMRISDIGWAGRVGINNVDPKASLHVDQTMMLTNNSIDINFHPVQINNTSEQHAVDPTQPSATYFTENWNSSPVDNAIVGIMVDKANMPDKKVCWSRSGYSFKGITINSKNGNVGVATWSAGSRLDVTASPRVNPTGRIPAFRILNSSGTEQCRISDDGYVLCRELKVALPQSGDWTWADYVFKKDYKLMPLGEVEEFIEQNGHLPGVPSAREISIEKGFAVGRMQAKLLEKIEELTLHRIRIEKELEATKSQLNQQTQGEGK